MKKIFSVAMMAIMALGAAVTTVSCTSNDDDSHAVDTKVNLSADLSSDAISYDCENDVYSAMTNFYQSKVGSTGTVRYTTTNGGEYEIYFSTTRANLVAFKQALKNISAEETNAVVKKFKVNWLNVTVTDGNEAVLKYNYENTQKEEEKKVDLKYYPVEDGAYTGTVNGVTYTVEFTSSKINDHEYKATVTIGDKVIPGRVFNVENRNFAFYSDEKVSGFSVYSAALVPTDSSMTKMKTIIANGIMPLVDSEFTKK